MLDHKLFYNDAMPIVDDLKLHFKEIDLQTCSKEIIFSIIEKLTHIDDNLKIFDEKEIELFTKQLKDLTIAIYKKKIPLDNDTLQLLFNSIDLIEILCFKYIFRYKIEDIHENIYATLLDKLSTLLSTLDPQDIELEDPLMIHYFNNHDKVILFVDDSIMIRKICERVAQTKGYKVMIANDGLHGLRLAMKYPFDLIFSDINMPKVDGLEMIGAIRKITHHYSDAHN